MESDRSDPHVKDERGAWSTCIVVRSAREGSQKDIVIISDIRRL